MPEYGNWHWKTPLDYYRFGREGAAELDAQIRQNRAGKVASTIMQTGDTTNPAMSDPNVQRTLGTMMRQKEYQDAYPIEQYMRQFKMGQAVNLAGQNAAMNNARLETEGAKAQYYKQRAEHPSGSYQGKQYTGNVGNAMQLAHDLSDLQEQMALAQKNPDPDPDLQAMKLNRLQNQLDTVKTSREVLLKKMEKEGAMGGGAKVNVSTGKDGQLQTKISGDLSDPHVQQLIGLKNAFPDAPAVPDANWLSAKDAEAERYLQHLAKLKETPEIAQERQRLTTGRSIIGQMRQPKQEEAAPVAKPVQGGGRKAGGIYRDASGNRAQFMGGDPSDPANYKPL